MFEKVPMLKEADPVAALVFSVFEFIVYSTLIQFLATLFRRFGERRKAGKCVKAS